MEATCNEYVMEWQSLFKLKKKTFAIYLFKGNVKFFVIVQLIKNRL